MMYAVGFPSDFLERMNDMSENLFEYRVKLAEDAIAHKEPERIPIWINCGSTPFLLDEESDSCYRYVFYDHDKAAASIIKFHQEFQPDVQMANLHCGPAEELAGTLSIDWPGRPGTRVPDTSIFQAHEHEFLEQEEYPEMLADFTGFMLKKYIPRAFPGLQGLGTMITPAPTNYMYFGAMRGLTGKPALEAYEKLLQIGKYQEEMQAKLGQLQGTLAGMGFPSMLSGVGNVPYDTLANYFRGTLGIFDDLIECEDMVEKAVDMFADLQIANLQYFKFAPIPIKRVMFWMHKGMDGFMSPNQYERLYWKPFLKVIHALADMGVTPIIYTEGPYHTRLEQMVDLPENKCVIHFEDVDLAKAKATIGKTNCITGNFPIYLLERGTVEQVVEEAKRQIDIGAPGGGFIFETNASIEGVKRENLHALYDTIRTYGKR